MNMPVEAYMAARARQRRYMTAPRAGWADPGKRTRDNQAILIPRKEAVGMADQLARTIYARETYLTEMLILRGYMSALARGKKDTVSCPSCRRSFRIRWMDGECPFCKATQEAAALVGRELSEAEDGSQ